MTTLSDILQDVLIYLGDFKEGKATGGSTNTVVDSTLGGAADDYNNGTVFVTYDAGGAAAAPEGQFAQVTDYAHDTGTITCAASSFTVAVAAGDYYGVSTKKWPLYKLISLVNSALSGVGDLSLVDTTTLDTAASQTEYACATAWKRSKPIRIDLQRITTDANDNKWQKIDNGDWEYVPATAGSTGLIVFRYQLPSSRDLRIWYKDVHPAVRIYSSTIREEIHPEHLIWETVYRALRWKKGMQDAPSGIEDMLMEADKNRREYGFLNKPREEKRRGRLMILNRPIDKDQFSYPGPA
jgi:hypothetical protein